VAKIKPANKQWTIGNYQSQGSDPLSLASYGTGSISTEDEFAGEPLPGWHLRLRHNLPATTLAVGTRKKLKLGRSTFYTKIRRESDGQVSQRLSVGEFDWEQCVPTTAPADADSIRLSVSNEVLSTFLKRCKGKQRQLMTGVVLGELRQTLHLIRRPLLLYRAGLDRYVHECRALRKNPKRLGRALSNEWLQFQFGVKPLVSDIESAVSSLVRFQHERVIASVGYQATAERLRDLKLEFVPAYPNNLSVNRQIRKTWSYSRRIIGAVYVEPNGPIAVQQSLGLGMRDFVPSIYELIPYSFLVDYFINIGEIIEAWSFNQCDLAWHNDTNREVLLTSVELDVQTLKSNAGNTLLDSVCAPVNSSFNITSFTRRSDPLGLPILALKFPGLGLKALNIGALASLRVLNPPKPLFRR
jgi:hypothetical protein